MADEKTPSKRAKNAPILYSYWRSSCSWRVRIALAFKQIAYDYRAVSLIAGGGQHLQAEFRQMNPMMQVPTFIDEGEDSAKRISQSMAILEYLEEKYPEPRLLPEDPYKRAKVRELAEIVNSGIQPLQNLSVLKKVGEEQKNEWAHFWIERGLTSLEETVKETAGTYCVGDNITLADCFLVPQMYNAARFNVDTSKFPTLVRINTRLGEHPAVVASHPDNQPDKPSSA